MRHGKKINHLGRTASHRSALLSNMASSLILHKRITTTVAKAKALKKYVEPIITKAKSDTTHSRRVVFSYLQNKDSVSTLFSEVADKVANRPGGYTRIFKMGTRVGDNADMCIMELVDFNELLMGEATAPVKAKTRRSRKAKGADTETTAEVKAKAGAAIVEDAIVVEETTPEDAADSKEEPYNDEEKENKA